MGIAHRQLNLPVPTTRSAGGVGQLAYVTLRVDWRLMVSDAQVRLLRQKRMDGKTQEAAAATAGMSLRTAQEWETGPLPSTTKRARDWRTRPDPFAAIWPLEIEPLLQSDRKGVLEAKLVLAELCARHPGQFHAGQERTLQRRFRDWRALHGPEPEVFFEQVAVPGREAAIDFTHASDLAITIAGAPFPSAVRIRAELQRLDVGGRRVGRNVRGLDGGRARRSVGARGRPGRSAQR
jgi:hypothetical protein